MPHILPHDNPAQSSQRKESPQRPVIETTLLFFSIASIVKQSARAGPQESLPTQHPMIGVDADSSCLVPISGNCPHCPVLEFEYIFDSKSEVVSPEGQSGQGAHHTNRTRVFEQIKPVIKKIVGI